MLLLPIYIDSCSSSTGATLNTGASSQCLEGVTTKLVLAKDTTRFDTIADFKDETVWAAKILAKDIVPLFSVYEVAEANTEATKYETGNFSYVTEKEVKKMTCESYLSLCSHKALKSYQNLGYNRIFEITDNGEALGVYDSDGVKVKGQKITEFDVAIRGRAVKDKPVYTMQTITFDDFEEFEDNGIIVKEAWDIEALMGIFSLRLEVQGTPTATEIQVKAYIGCGTDTFDDLVLANWKLNTGQTITGSVNANGVYTLSGTGLVSGTLETDGVVTVDSYMYESAEAITITI